MDKNNSLAIDKNQILLKRRETYVKHNLDNTIKYYIITFCAFYSNISANLRYLVDCRIIRIFKTRVKEKEEETMTKEERKVIPNIQKKLNLIEAIVANPSATNVQLAEIVQVNRNTIANWKKNPDFQQMLKERLQDVWKDSEAIAIRSMRKLASEGNFNASKYILDNMGYAPTARQEIGLASDINITIG